MQLQPIHHAMHGVGGMGRGDVGRGKLNVAVDDGERAVAQQPLQCEHVAAVAQVVDGECAPKRVQAGWRLARP